jgi:hypothetical protein
MMLASGAYVAGQIFGLALLAGLVWKIIEAIRGKDDDTPKP